MKRFICLSFASIFCFIAPANAGFEWMPPSKQPAPTPDIIQQYDTMSHETGMNSTGMNHMGGMPAMPVSSEPLNALAPTPIMPQRQRQVAQDGKLYINPYPLQDAFRTGEPSQLTGSSVEKAMVEESRMLHPLHLGAGMKTGAQPVKEQADYGDANTYQTAALPMKSMTPMVGGEPASLPGMGTPRGPMQATPIGGFTEAVGFGRDLPLALALSQVIPAHYTHSYAGAVDPGVTVSWEGGKPWNQVLNEMLATQGLNASIRGNQVIIQSAFQS